MFIKIKRNLWTGMLTNIILQNECEIHTLVGTILPLQGDNPTMRQLVALQYHF